MSKNSLNRVNQPAEEVNIYEFLDDFTDEDEPVQSPQPQSQPPPTSGVQYKQPRRLTSPRSSSASKTNSKSSRTTNSAVKSRRQSGRRQMLKPYVVYRRVQAALIYACLILTLVQLGLVIWINVEKRFRFLAQISNTLAYSSLDRMFGLYPIIALSLTSLALILDLIQFGQFVFIKSFLRTKQKERSVRYIFLALTN